MTFRMEEPTKVSTHLRIVKSSIIAAAVFGVVTANFESTKLSRTTCPAKPLWRGHGMFVRFEALVSGPAVQVMPLDRGIRVGHHLAQYRGGVEYFQAVQITNAYSFAIRSLPVGKALTASGDKLRGDQRLRDA